MNKLWLSADQLLQDAWKLGLKVFESGYRPTVVLGVWRGGCTVAVAVHELLKVLGVDAQHYPLKTRFYTGVGRRSARVAVSGLELFAHELSASDRVLLVDDVHDTGLSLDAVVGQLMDRPEQHRPELRVAVPYFKPASNQSGRIPDYYLVETDAWIVFPHELEGIDAAELMAHKPGVGPLRDYLARK